MVIFHHFRGFYEIRNSRFRDPEISGRARARPRTTWRIWASFAPFLAVFIQCQRHLGRGMDGISKIHDLELEKSKKSQFLANLWIFYKSDAWISGPQNMGHARARPRTTWRIWASFAPFFKRFDGAWVKG